MNYFEPIIGQSFDSLAGQRQFWAGLNSQTEEANMRRAQAAEQARNNYFSNAASSQQAAMDRDAELRWHAGVQANASAAQARAEEDAQRREARRIYEWGEGQKLTAQEIAKRDKSTADALSEKKREFDTSVQAAKKQSEDDLNNTGQSFAVTYAASKRQLDGVSQMADKLKQEHDELTNKVTDLGKKEDKSPDDIIALSKANSRLGELKKILPKALTAEQRAEQHHLTLSDNLTSKGFVPNEEDGTLTHLSTGKSWNFSSALKKAKNAIADKNAIAETAGTGTQRTFFGQTNQTETATNSPAPPVITSQEQYDQLQPNDLYYDEGGNVRRKK